MDLFEEQVPNTDSALIQSGSGNELPSENFTNTFQCPENEPYLPDLKESLRADGNFEFDANPFPCMGADPAADNPEYLPSIERLIQENVSRSTARLLTKNALKYLDRDFPVSAGHGVSQQFTVRSPKHKTAGSTSRRGEPQDIPGPSDDGRGLFELPGPLPVDPKISSFKLHKVTYEMYKLFDSIKSLELSNRSQGESSYDFVTVRDKTTRTLESTNQAVEQRRLSRKSSILEEVSVDPYFESRLKPKPFPSMSTLYPEDVNMTANSVNRLDNISLGFTDNNSHRLDNFGFNLSDNANAEPDKSDSNAFELEQEKFDIEPFVANPPGSTDFDSKDDSDYPAFSSDDQNEHAEPFEPGLDKGADQAFYTCFNGPSSGNARPESNRDAGTSSHSCDPGPSGHDESLKSTRVFKPTFVTRVYAPMDRTLPLPKKRAVVIGCNYLGNPDAQLRGGCNDAFAFAQVLVSKFNFDPRNVVLLIDAAPSAAYTRHLSQFKHMHEPQAAEGFDFNLDLGRLRRGAVERNVYPTKRTSMFGRHLVERELKHLSLSENLCLDSTAVPAPPEMHPTRGNVFRSLKWLNFTSCPNDLAFVYFSGQSVQLDDLSGYEGDGFDEALVPVDFEKNGLVTCNDLRCLFQSIGATCTLGVFLDSCNMQTVVGGSSRAGPLKGSKMKGLWPFSEPTGKLKAFECDEEVFRDPRMINQMTRVKFLNTVQVDSLSSLSDVQLSLDASHGVVNYFVLSSSSLNSVSLECLFKPLNLAPLSGAPSDKVPAWKYSSFTQGNEEAEKMVRDDEVVVHGAFTYALLLTLLFDRSSRRGGLGVDELVEGVNKKLSQLRRMRLPRLSQQCEALFYHSAKLPKNALVFPNYPNAHPQAKYADTPYGYLLPEDAWMFMVSQGRERAREHQEKFERMKTDLITLTNLNSKIFNQNTARSELTAQRRGEGCLNAAQNTARTVNRTMPTTSRRTNLGERGLEGAAAASSDNATTAYNARAGPATTRGVAKSTGRSLTNSVQARVFTRNSSASGRASARSKTATLNLPANAHAAFQGGADWTLKDAVPTHNWYGGTVVSVPVAQEWPGWPGKTAYHNTGYVNYGGRPAHEQAYHGDAFYRGQFETMPVYEPITAAMIRQLPTTNSFTALRQ